MIGKNCNLKSCFMKLLKFVGNILAWGPTSIVVSSLISILLILPFTFLPYSEIKLTINSVYIQLPIIYLLELIIVSLMFFYVIRLCSVTRNVKSIIMYSLLTITSILIFIYFQRLVILLQPIPPIVFSVIFEKRLCKIKNFLNTSKLLFVFLNIFDTCYIFKLQWIVQLKDIPEEFYWLILLLIFFIFPLLRTLLLYIYIRQVKKEKSKDKTYLFSYVTMFMVSLFQIAIYSIIVLNFMESKEKSIINVVFAILIVATLSIYFWALLKKQIDRGGENKKYELLRFTVGVLIFVFIFFYDKIEGEFLVILSWLLPVLISTIVGDLHYQFITDDSLCLPIPTMKMKKHVYSLQLISFLTLFCLNLFSAVFTTNRIEGNKIVPSNTGKDSLIKLLNLISNGNQEPIPEVLSSYTSSFIIVSLSFILALILSAVGVKLLKLNYSDSAKGYYEYRNTRLSTLINRRYKRYIHKRRKNNV